MNRNTSVATAGALESLTMMPWRGVFAGRHELLATLLDGAQRSGASVVNIEYQESLGILRLSDDGSLPNGPRALAAVRAGMLSSPEAFTANRPDLLRYAAMLACAKQLKVHTAAHAVTLHPERFLRDNEVRPTRISSVRCGVNFVLDLLPEHRCSRSRLHQEISALVRGFPLPVFLDGSALPRPYAIAERPYIRFAHGLYCVDPSLDHDEHYVFLDGLPIESGDGKPTYLPGGVVVHLHPEIFQSVTPGHREIAGGAITLAFLRYELQLLTGRHAPMGDETDEEAWHERRVQTQ
jgi:hypothetical protein